MNPEKSKIDTVVNTAVAIASGHFINCLFLMSLVVSAMLTAWAKDMVKITQSAALGLSIVLISA